MKLAEKIYMLRRRQNLSQEQLADALGVSRQAVSKWEVGESLPEVDKLPLLCAAFGVTADYLLNDDMEEPAALAPAAAGQKPKEAFIIILFMLIVGLVTAWAGWYNWQTIIPVAIGFCIQVCACASYELIALSVLPKEAARPLRRRFYGITAWLLLPIPLFVLVNAAFSLLWFAYPAVLPFVVICTLYFILASLCFILLIRKTK